MINGKYVSAVIVAAGSSQRMGADKIIMPLSDIPVIVRTLEAFEKSEYTDEVTVVTSSDKIDLFSGYKEKYGLKKVCNVVLGGDCRQQSAANGFFACNGNADIIAVHDGARPLVRPEIIDKTVENALKFGAAVAAVPEKNTIKVSDSDGFISKTLDRRMIYSAVTPQAFTKEIYRKTIDAFSSRFNEFTDDSSMAEMLGIKVKIVECEPENIKITTAGDLFIAERILAGRNK